MDSYREEGPRGTIFNERTEQETLSFSAELFPEQGFVLSTGQNTRSVFTDDGRELVDLGDVSVEAHATLVEWETGAVWGIVCRHQTGNLGYEVAINLDEAGLEADIWRITEEEGTTEQLAHTDELPAEVTVEEGEPNDLRVDCIGDTITLFVDGIEIVEAEDDFYPSGSVGLFITAFVPQEIPDEVGAKATIEFDNLKVSAPPSDS